MAASDLAELLPETRAKLAKHLAALANHGGGFIVIGVDDATRVPTGAPPAGLAKIDQEAVAGILKRYLSPPFQIQVESAEQDGVGYPVVVVPRRGRRDNR
ncbi:hypothetical protein B6S44_06960 [Bosea sp. Tri-44]|uniref:AlbA family DNA-binding domain-containing protein n=1 Tax=Bosea sp. Tri-44 TaxID=1972137 RepID=UPI00100E8CF2|nr:RNA-binding domain-containing protein [Bosea sp. Tri-44]RXT55829.1 hypothetical protein B6S44_06960 [Bosea sp. Tri-44]